MFFQVDDQFQVNPKSLDLARMAMDGTLDGLAALGLWVMAGSTCQAKLTDGVVDLKDLISLTLSKDVAERLAGHLCEVGLWHGPGHDCERCPDVEEGHYLFHDWFDLRYDRAEAYKISVRKKKELKDRGIINAVWARDRVSMDATPGKGDVAKCRYCARIVKRADRRGPGRWELDHVDPNLAIGPENIVVSCLECNRRKGARTPEEAGMVLLPPPGAAMPRVSGDEPVEGIDSDLDLGNDGPTQASVGSEWTPEAVSAGVPRVSGDEPAGRLSDGVLPEVLASGKSSLSDSAEAGTIAGVPETVLATQGGESVTIPAKSPEPVVYEVFTKGSEQDKREKTGEKSNVATFGFTFDFCDTNGCECRETVYTLSPPAGGRVRGPAYGDGRVKAGLNNSGLTQGAGKVSAGSEKGLAGSRPGDGTGSGGVGASVPAVGHGVASGGSGRGVRRRKKRSRGRAGAVPEVVVPGRLGSPWRGWHGAPSDVTETVCDEHGQHWPCRFCQGGGDDAGS